MSELWIFVFTWKGPQYSFISCKGILLIRFCSRGETQFRFMKGVLRYVFVRGIPYIVSSQAGGEGGGSFGHASVRGILYIVSSQIGAPLHASLCEGSRIQFRLK